MAMVAVEGPLQRFAYVEQKIVAIEFAVPAAARPVVPPMNIAHRMRVAGSHPNNAFALAVLAGFHRLNICRLRLLHNAHEA